RTWRPTRAHSPAGFRRKFDPEFTQLSRAHFGRRLRHQFLTAIVFRERHDIADRMLSAKQHYEPIKPEGDSAVRRRAQTEGAQQMAKLRLLFFGTNSEHIEHFGLE